MKVDMPEVSDAAPADPAERNFADLPEDALNSIYALLPAYSLRAAAASNTAWFRALKQAPQPVRWRASWLHHWTLSGAGASIQRADPAVCTGDGTWSPGGVALASTLHLSRAQHSGFRLVIEDAAPGDLLMGITLHQPDAPASAAGAAAAGTAAASACAAAAGDDGGVPPANGGPPPPPLLEMGYHFIMGRSMDADGDIQMSPPVAGRGGGLAPRSIFYGGRSRRCCFATPTVCEMVLVITLTLIESMEVFLSVRDAEV